MKKLISALLVLMMLLAGVSAMASSEWPARTIELVVPANPGGDTDANARALAAALTEEMGWNVVVSNMAGGAGIQQGVLLLKINGQQAVPVRLKLD